MRCVIRRGTWRDQRVWGRGREGEAGESSAGKGGEVGGGWGVVEVDRIGEGEAMMVVLVLTCQESRWISIIVSAIHAPPGKAVALLPEFAAISVELILLLKTFRI